MYLFGLLNIRDLKLCEEAALQMQIRKRTKFFDSMFFRTLIGKGKGRDETLSADNYNFDKTKKWARDDLFEHERLLIPANDPEKKHWCLSEVDFQNLEITYYDGCTPNGRQEMFSNSLLRYLKDMWALLKSTPFPTGWRVRRGPILSLQTDGTSCGLFTFAFAELRSRGASVSGSTLDQGKINRMRLALVLEIMGDYGP